MAGANNKAMKAAGLPKKTQDTVRVALGAGMTVQSAIRHAQAHGLPLGKAKTAGELTGWQRAAAGVKPSPRAESPAAPKFRGAGPFNPERHRARALALATARKAQFAEADARRTAVRDASDKEQATANRAYLKAGDAMDRADALSRRANDKLRAARMAAGDGAEARKAALGAAMTKRQGNLTRAIGAAGKGALAARKATQAATAQKRAADAAAAAKPQFKGAGPFNVDRHKARAMALSEARKAQLKAADARLQSAKTPEERATASKAYNVAQRRADNAAALNRGASAKVSERDAVRRGEKGTMPVRMRQARADVAGLRAPGKGQAHIMTAEGPKVIDTVASSKNFFVHKEPGYGGQFVVSHRDTGMAITQSNTLSGAKRVMDGMKKTGHLTMRRLEQGGSAGERAARAMAKYLSAPKRRNVSLAERGLRAGSAPTKRGKEANAAAGIR